MVDAPTQLDEKLESEAEAPSNPLYIAGRVYHVTVATRRAPRYRVSMLYRLKIEQAFILKQQQHEYVYMVGMHFRSL